jgi:hypothetical protein
MKALALLLIMLATSAQAGGSLYEKNQFETREQARQRHSAENYDAYKRDSRNEIPPPYQGTFGGTEKGAERPGYRDYRYGSDR